MKISAVIITFNEEQNIGRCIESLSGLADEVVVVDSKSTDHTKNIAEGLGARVIEQDFLGYIEQKNFAITKASHPWILSLDADEALSSELKKSIQHLKEKDLGNDAYEFNRLSSYCGKWVRHCGWYPDKKTRLFKADAGAWGGKNPHDKFLLNQGMTLGFLKGDLLHYTFRTKEEHKTQIEKFTTIAAQAYYEKGIKSNGLKLLFSPIAKFVRNYILKLGFLDGATGWTICTASAKATYLKYVKLIEIQKSKRA